MELEDARRRQKPTQIEVHEVDEGQELRERVWKLDRGDVRVLGQDLRPARSGGGNENARENESENQRGNENEGDCEKETENGKVI